MMIILLKTQLQRHQIDLNSVYHPLMLIMRIFFIQDSNSFQLLVFNQKSLETTKGFSNKIKLKDKYVELLKNKLKLNDKVKKYSYLFLIWHNQTKRNKVLIVQSFSCLRADLKIIQILEYLLSIDNDYTNDHHPLQMKSFFVLFLILKIIDAILKSISTFAINGEIETQLIVIICHYCKSQWIFDIIFIGSIQFQQNYWNIIKNILSTIPSLIQIQKQVQFEYNIFN
ncbi:unnamed protein product [Paramecium sonneborni]|uniref:Uncharacterized protein n=1 Tax=Paramecium sonneborni TaxID=65129 RepID=A0A8S1RM82_9CILI|nr:unnamed protein product [Paramecium sonneborni]